ncbi:hypothetical protein ABK040_008966 [Willaertia magna]
MSLIDIPNEIIEHILIPYFTNKEQLQILQYINKIFYFYINDNNKWKNDILKFTNIHLDNLNNYLNSYRNYYRECDFYNEFDEDVLRFIVKEQPKNNLQYDNIYCYISGVEHDINLKSNLPIPNLEKDNICQLPIYYIELTILQKIDQQNITNSFGIIPKNYFVSGRVGYNGYSVGLYFDNGKILMYDEEVVETSLKIDIGDTIGFGFYQPKKCIFFTHNGTFYTSPVVLDYIIKEEEENVEETKENKMAGDEVKENEEKIRVKDKEEEKEKPWVIGGFWEKCKIQMNFGELPFLFDFSSNIEKLIEEETIERRTLKAEYLEETDEDDEESDDEDEEEYDE